MDPRERKTDFDLNKVDYPWIESCEHKIELYQALHALKLDGCFPHLEKAVEEKLEKIDPKFVKKDDYSNVVSQEEIERTKDELEQFFSKIQVTDQTIKSTSTDFHAKMEKARVTAEYETKKRAEEERLNGNDAIKAKDYKEAISYYDKSIQIDPNEPATYCNRAAAYLSLKNYSKVIEDCNKTIELKPDYLKAYYRRGRAYFYLQKYQESIRDNQTVLEHDPNNVDANRSLKEARSKLPTTTSKENEKWKSIAIEESDDDEENANVNTFVAAKEEKSDKKVEEIEEVKEETKEEIKEEIIEEIDTKSSREYTKQNSKSWWADSSDPYEKFDKLSPHHNKIPKTNNFTTTTAPQASTPKQDTKQDSKQDTKQDSKQDTKPNKEDILKEVEQGINASKEEGNKLYKENNFTKAVDAYQKGIDIYEKNKEIVDKKDLITIIVNLYTNKAICNLKIGGKQQEVIKDCSNVIDKLDHKSSKAYYRRAVAFKEKMVFGKALEDYKMVVQLEPKNDSVRKEMEEVSNYLKKEIEKEDAKKKKEEDERKQKEQNEIKLKKEKEDKERKEKLPTEQKEKEDKKRKINEERDQIEIKKIEEAKKKEESKKKEEPLMPKGIDSSVPTKVNNFMEEEKPKTSHKKDRTPKVPENILGSVADLALKEINKLAPLTKPKTSYAFEKDWMHYRKNHQGFYLYLCNLEPMYISSLFKDTQISPEIFMGIVNTISSYGLTDNVKFCTDTLIALKDTKSFDTTLMFLEDDERERVLSLISKIKEDKSIEDGKKKALEEVYNI